MAFGDEFGLFWSSNNILAYLHGRDRRFGMSKIGIENSRIFLSIILSIHVQNGIWLGRIAIHNPWHYIHSYARAIDSENACECVWMRVILVPPEARPWWAHITRSRFLQFTCAEANEKHRDTYRKYIVHISIEWPVFFFFCSSQFVSVCAKCVCFVCVCIFYSWVNF